MILAEGYWHGDEYIPEIVDDPWANLERVAQVLGRKQIDVHAYADPRRVAQELAADVRHAYEQGNLSDTLVGRLHDLIDSAYLSWLPRPYSPECVEVEFCELRPNGVSEVRMQVMHRLLLRAARMASKGLHAARINTGPCTPKGRRG